MPVVTVNIPEAKGSDTLQKSLLREFESLRKQLQGIKDAPDHSETMLKSMLKQQDALVKAMERMMSRMMKSNHNSGDSMKELKVSLGGLGNELKSAMVGAMKHKESPASSRPHVTVNPQVKVNLNGLGKRLDRMEDLIVKNMRSRNRTFGSNY